MGKGKSGFPWVSQTPFMVHFKEQLLLIVAHLQR